MPIPIVLLITGILTSILGAMYYQAQNSTKPGIHFYTSAGVAQIITSAIFGGFVAHWAIGIAVLVLLTFFFYFALERGGMI